MISILFLFFALLQNVRLCQCVTIDQYQVEISGNVRGQIFTRTASFYLAPSLDAFLVSGFPAATPELGAIWLSSNREFYRLFETRYPPGQNQLMSVSSNGQGTVIYTILTDVAKESVVLNSMTASGGIFAFDYILSQGTMVCQFDGTAVQGTVDVIGISPNTLFNERYSAQFTGNRIQSFEF